MNRTSKVWWFPLASRVMGWALTGALLWAVPAVTLIGSLTFYVYLHPSPTYPEVGIDEKSLYFDILLWFCIVSSGIFAVMGMVTGFVAAFYSPAKDTNNPLKSRLFRSVNRRTFCLTSATSLLCCLTVGVLLYPAFAFAFWIPFGLWLVISIVLFSLALWRAVNRALAEAVKSNCNA